MRRFNMNSVPKAPGRRPPKPVVPKTGVVDDAESLEAKELMRRFNDGLSARKPKYEKKYALDEEEFGTLFESTDKKRMSTTAELGLIDEFSEPRLMLFQLPRTVPLPVIKQDDASSSNQPNPGPSVNKCGLLKDLPEGLMGKLLVYNSGKVKLKLGDVLYDVNPGSDCKFAQDAVAMNTNEKHCSILGQIHEHAVVTPDVGSILDNITDQAAPVGVAFGHGSSATQNSYYNNSKPEQTMSKEGKSDDGSRREKWQRKLLHLILTHGKGQEESELRYVARTLEAMMYFHLRLGNLYHRKLLEIDTHLQDATSPLIEMLVKCRLSFDRVAKEKIDDLLIEIEASKRKCSRCQRIESVFIGATDPNGSRPRYRYQCWGCSYEESSSPRF